jgi:uncharacterized DUF497 family protein
MEPRHERIARIALAAGARYGLALAGGYAVSAHGMGNRPSGDVDLFTSWQHRGEFPELTAAVIAALESAGYKVSVIMSAETFTRLTLASTEGGAEEKVELAVDWRAHDPVQLAVGPVLHSDDAVANKVCALFGRALPRDFLDVDAVVMSGRYTHEQMLQLAAEADHGFDQHGVDFVQAQELWQDAMRIEVPARTTGEPRWLVVGRMGGKHWSAVVTYREDRIRIIAVRRARDEEIRTYEV